MAKDPTRAELKAIIDSLQGTIRRYESGDEVAGLRNDVKAAENAFHGMETLRDRAVTECIRLDGLLWVAEKLLATRTAERDHISTDMNARLDVQIARLAALDKKLKNWRFNSIITHFSVGAVIVLTGLLAGIISIIGWPLPCR